MPSRYLTYSDEDADGNPTEDDFAPNYLGSDDTPPPMGSNGLGGSEATHNAPEKTSIKTPAQIARDKVAELSTQRPERPHVGFWRQLGAIGLGAAGAYANAENNRYGRPGTVDVGGVIDNVRYGGYNRKLSDWQNQVGDADVAARNLEEGEKIGQAGNENVARTDLQRAQTGLTTANTDAIRAGSKEKPYTVVPANGNVLNNKTGQFIDNPNQRAASAPKTIDDALIRALTLQNGGNPPSTDQLVEVKKRLERVPPDKMDSTTVALIASGWDPESGMKPTPQQAAAATKLTHDNSLAQFAQAMTQDRFNSTKSTEIETRKQAALQKAEQAFSKATNDPNAPLSERDKQIALNALNAEKSRIQNAYQSEVSAAFGGRNPEHHDNPGGPVPMGPPPSPEPPPAPVAPMRAPAPQVRQQAPPGMVLLRSPNGQVQPVPKSQQKHYMDLGATLVQ